MTTTHHSSHHSSRLGTHPRPATPRSATDWSVAALCKLLDAFSAWSRYRHRDDSSALDIRLSADPDRQSCIVGVVGTVDQITARELSRVLQTVRGYPFVSIDLTAATFVHPAAQVRFDEASEQLEFSGSTVVVSGARDDMGTTE